MLVRLMYASRATSPIDTEMLNGILAKAMHNNASLGVTGLLCHSGDVFMQVLEGGRGAVSGLYNRIAMDRQHRDVTLLAYEEIAERAFAAWSMGRVDMGLLNPGLVMKYCETAALDPYAMTGPAAVAMLRELVETAAVACLA